MGARGGRSVKGGRAGRARFVCSRLSRLVSLSPSSGTTAVVMSRSPMADMAAAAISSEGGRRAAGAGSADGTCAEAIAFRRCVSAPLSLRGRVC